MLNELENLFNDKKLYTIFVVTCSVAMIVVAFFIFFPFSKVPEIATYETIDVELKNKNIANEYLNKLIFYFRYGQTTEILSKISKEYLKYMNYTADDIKNNILSKKVNAFSGLEIRQNGDTIIYTTNIIYDDSTKIKMNIIESYPYNYTIAFDDFCNYQSSYVGSLLNGIDLKINNVYSGLNSKKYEISIKNINNSKVSFNIGNIKKVYLELNDGTQYNLSNIVMSADMSNINKGTTINKIFEFDIPYDMQSKVDNLIFKDVIIDEKVKDIKIKL